MKTEIIGKYLSKRLKRSKDKSIVKLYINNESDLFNNYTYFNNEACNDNVKINVKIVDYIKTEIENIPKKHSLIIALRLHEKLTCTVEQIEKLIKNDIYRKIEIINKKLRKSTIASFSLALLGMIFIAITQVFKIMEKRYSLNELIIVMSWVFMWTAIDKIFFERPKLMNEKMKLLKIYFSEVINGQ